MQVTAKAQLLMCHVSSPELPNKLSSAARYKLLSTKDVLFPEEVFTVALLNGNCRQDRTFQKDN